MWFACLALPALATPLTVRSASPVSVRVDGVWIGRVTNEATADLPAGKVLVEVCDVFGDVVGSTEIRLEEAPVVLQYADHRLDPVVEPAAPAEDARAPMDEAAFTALERSLVGGSPKRRLERLEAGLAGQWVNMRQVGELLLAFDVLEDRVTAALLLAPRTLDPQNVGAIEGRFPSSETRERVRAAFAGG